MNPSKEAGMKVSVLNLFYIKKIFYGLVEYAKKTLSLEGVCIKSRGIESLQYLEVKAGGTY